MIRFTDSLRSRLAVTAGTLTEHGATADDSSAASAVEAWKGQRITSGPSPTDSKSAPAGPVASRATSAAVLSSAQAPPPAAPSTASAGSVRSSSKTAADTADEAELMRAPAPRRREKVPPAERNGLVAPAHGLSQITWARAKSQAEEDTQREWRGGRTMGPIAIRPQHCHIMFGS